MSFDQPRLTLFGHHPLGARTRYLLLTLAAFPLLLVLPTDAGQSKRQRWRQDFLSLRGLP